jgi:hypothetical protein
VLFGVPGRQLQEVWTVLDGSDGMAEHCADPLIAYLLWIAEAGGRVAPRLPGGRSSGPGVAGEAGRLLLKRQLNGFLVALGSI